MMTFYWLKGLFRHRSLRVFGAAVGVAITISLIASTGIFITDSNRTMTKRAISTVPIDWQIQLSNTADINQIEMALSESVGYSKLETVHYADVTGFQASKDGTVQTTGVGKVLGISSSYADNFPLEFRYLLGAQSGVLIAQQTAANLHATVGDTVSILLPNNKTFDVKVDGIIDLPDADSLFQGIGLPANSTPQAPPDNIFILPDSLWQSIFDDQMLTGNVQTQLHAKVNHDFPADPNIALNYVTGKTNNFEAKVVGSAAVGDNLSAKLYSAREESIYSKVLFLFLGFPGVLLGIILTILIISSGIKHRKQDQFTLRTQGYKTNKIIQIEALEALLVFVIGSILGVLLTSFNALFFIKTVSFATTDTAIWLIFSIIFGGVLSFASVLIPVWKATKEITISQIKKVRGNKKPLWLRLYVDVVLLIAAICVYWQTASTSYKIVLAPEGVLTASVNYFAFIAPLCFWLGTVLLAIRLVNLLLTRGNKLVSQLIKPISNHLSALIANSWFREKTFILRGIVLIALSISFAVSTSIFNTTYNAQARVDAQLTNGADVTISAAVPFSQDDPKLTQLSIIPDIAGVELMQHRFAYVGNDLQDIYGIDPLKISNATTISDAYFASGKAKTELQKLAQTEDGVFVSQETVNDYQLSLGDTINLRLQDATDHAYHIIPFKFIGIVREFPTAPKDSFLVANASYISKMSHNNGFEDVLLKAKGNDVTAANSAKQIVGDVGYTVTDLTTVQNTINSSLTSVDLKGLTVIELIYALMFAILSTGVLFGLGVAERKRNFAVLNALGANSRQLGAFIWSEGLFLLAFGVVFGAGIGLGIAQILVKILQGVFDPPPEFLSFPTNYLFTLFVLVALSLFLIVNIMLKISKRPPAGELRKN